jgi:hypothetical protein
MLPNSFRWLVVLVGVALVAPCFGQVVTPPGPRPEREPAFVPNPPAERRPAPRPSRPRVPDVDYEPITERDASGRIVPLEIPPEYAALSHNPLIDVRALAAMAPGLYERRLRVERLVAEHIDLLLDVEAGAVEQTRLADAESLRESAGRLMVFTDNPGVAASLTSELVEAGRLSPEVGLLTQKILQDHQQDVTRESMGMPTTEDGATGMDQMMHRIMRLTISEFEHHFRRLLLDVADYFEQIRPELGLDAQVSEAVEPLARRLAGEGDMQARARLIREILGLMDSEARRRAAAMAIELRPAVDPAGLMAPVPEGAETRALDNETRRELILQLVEGGRVETESLLR